MPRPENEAALVASSKQGDKTAFGVLVEAYSSSLFNMALRMTGNVAEAEEMLQETFIRAYRSLNGFDSERRFSTWLFAICINTCRNLLRKRKTSPLSQCGARDVETMAAATADTLSPGESMLASERHTALVAALQRLPVGQREAVVLRYFQELPFAEVAALLEITENAAKKRVYQGVARLYEHLCHLEPDRKRD